MVAEFFRLFKNKQGQVINLEGKCSIAREFIAFNHLAVAHILAHVKTATEGNATDDDFHQYANDYFINYIKENYNFGHCAEIATADGLKAKFFHLSVEHIEIVVQNINGRTFSHLSNKSYVAYDFAYIHQMLSIIDWR